MMGQEILVKTLKEYRDVFASSYKYLKGIDPEICQHTIPMKEDAKPSRQRPYTYNDTFAKRIKEEIDKLKDPEFIYKIEHTGWDSPIVVVPKKSGKLRVCINLKKVNAATIRNYYPLPITKHVLERVAEGRKLTASWTAFSDIIKSPLILRINKRLTSPQNGVFLHIVSCYLA